MDTARQIKETCGVSSFIFRAGAWKPRTRPDTFQGIGAPALAWLQEVKSTFHVPVATEVATPEHVAAALSAGIDFLWIGARTSANPIAVTEIASQMGDRSLVNGDLKGLLIKNPVNADAKLWLGNIARLEQTGVPVIAVLRGCDHKPCWAMAHQVRTARPDIPMLLDPSHLSGDARQVPLLLPKVEDLGLDGIMIEVHNNPAKALSDAKQQISPAELTAALKNRSAAETSTANETKQTELNWLRAEIDELDERLWDTLAARMDVSRRIGEWKKTHGVAPLQPERFRQILAQRQTWAKENGFEAEFAERLWNIIHEQSLKQQE